MDVTRNLSFKGSVRDTKRFSTEMDRVGRVRIEVIKIKQVFSSKV